MDAFYASVEQRDNPALRGRPLIVGGRADERGVVATASYEARSFGIHSAMPTRTALRLCPQAQVVAPRFSAYKQASEHIRSIFADYTDLIEPLSLDEAYLDVSNNTKHQGSATLIAQDIKRRIWDELHLTASAGVSYNKFLAKVASDYQKPNGLTIITPEFGPSFAAQLPIGRFWGVGRVTEQKMHSLGIRSGADLLACDRERLRQIFRKSADFYLQLAQGVDERAVVSTRERKSIGREQTYSVDIKGEQQMLAKLYDYAQGLHRWCQEREVVAHTLTLKVRYPDFRTVTRARSNALGYAELSTITDTIPHLLAETEARQRNARLLGLSLSKFGSKG